MADTVTRIHHQSYSSRLSSACCAMLCCPIFVCLGSWLLIWNEGYSIKQHRALTEGSQLVVEVTNLNAINPSFNGKPIHFTGVANASSPISDPLFGVAPPSQGALKLKRYVEMYQWVEDSHTETKKNSDGSTDTITTYSYYTDWKDTAISSSSFEEPFSHENPGSMMFPSETFTADAVQVGAYAMTDEVLGEIDWFKRIYAPDLSKDTIPDKNLRHETIVYDGYFYYGSPSWQHVGDTRVSFSEVPAQTISVVALQSNGVPTSYTASNGNSFLLVEQGEQTTEVMFENAHKQVSIQTWLLRFFGFVIIWIGFRSLLEPAAVATGCIPCVGDLTEAVANSVSFLLGFCVSLVIIAVAWLAYRPVLSVSLIALAICCGVCGMHRDDHDEPTIPTNPQSSNPGWYDEVPTVQAIPLNSQDQYRGYGQQNPMGNQGAPFANSVPMETPNSNPGVSYADITPIPVSHAISYGATAPSGNMAYGATAPSSNMAYGATAPSNDMEKYR